MLLFLELPAFQGLVAQEICLQGNRVSSNDMNLSGYQGIMESYLNLARPLAQGATILGTQDKEYIILKGEM